MRTCPTDGCGSGASIDRSGSPARSSTIARTARAYRRCRPVFPATPRREAGVLGVSDAGRPVCSALATRRVPRSDALRSPRRRRSRAHRPATPADLWSDLPYTGVRCPVATRPGLFVLFGARREWMSVSLREALDLFVGSETFEGL